MIDELIPRLSREVRVSQVLGRACAGGTADCELVTNAVAATGVTEAEPRWSQLAGLATIHVRVMLFEGSIVIAVWDRTPAPPVLRQSEPDSENGRGLSIVAALCKRWDYFLLYGGGKCVWAELAIQPAALPPAELPRRVPAPSGVRAAEPGTDPGVLRRVHEGLKNL